MAVRTGVGIFDRQPHGGTIRLAGREALAAVHHISMNDASAAGPSGRRSNSALLYPQGTFVG